MNNQEKSVEISELSDIFSSSSSIVVADYKGLNVAQMKDLRDRLREAGGGVRIAKNTLVKVAIRDLGFVVDFADLFVGQSLIVYSVDPVIASKISVGFANDNSQFEILGGILEKDMLTQDSIKKIASLPNIEEIRSGILSAIQSSATRLVMLLETPQNQIVRILSAFEEKNRQD
ncbi:Large ribosomal subunit protein uL10 [Candidatus Liberibacter solanacearum]